MSLASAQSAGVDTSSAGRSKNLFASLFHSDDEEDDRTQPAPASTASRTYSLASVSEKASDMRSESTRPATVPVPVVRPQRTALAAVVGASSGNDDGVVGAAASADRDPWATAGLAQALRPPAGVSHAPLSNPDKHRPCRRHKCTSFYRPIPLLHDATGLPTLPWLHLPLAGPSY